jgi:hypothetical protein
MKVTEDRQPDQLLYLLESRSQLSVINEQSVDGIVPPLTKGS